MRALTPQEREARRDALADHAVSLFPETGYGGLTIEAVARRAGLAKGTVFLAFASKEDLVLHAVGRRYGAWFQRLAGLDPASGPASLARGILDTVRDDGLLMPLLALVNPVLEHGASPEAVVAFKAGLAGKVGVLARLWASRAPGVSPDLWVPLFLRLHALAVGAWTVGETSARVREMVEGHPELEMLFTPFDELFPSLLEVQLQAVLR